MTSHEKELVAALEVDIKIWEQEISFFDNFVKGVEDKGGHALTGKEYADGLRNRIQEWRALIERVKKG